jgi:hypothetical protein
MTSSAIGKHSPARRRYSSATAMNSTPMPERVGTCVGPIRFQTNQDLRPSSNRRIVFSERMGRTSPEFLQTARHHSQQRLRRVRRNLQGLGGHRRSRPRRLVSLSRFAPTMPRVSACTAPSCYMRSRTRSLAYTIAVMSHPSEWLVPRRAWRVGSALAAPTRATRPIHAPASGIGPGNERRRRRNIVCGTPPPGGYRCKGRSDRLMRVTMSSHLRFSCSG